RVERRVTPRSTPAGGRAMTRPVRSLLPFAEAALLFLSLAVVFGFARLFNDGSFFPRLAAFAVVAHGTAIVTRRLGWSLAASAGLSLVALGVTVGLALYPDTTFLGLPTADTLTAARTDFSDVWSQFQSVQAPTAVTTAFLLVHRVARQQTSPGWVTSDIQRGTNSMLRTGAGLLVVAIVLAMLLGPNLPQAHSAAILSWRGGGSGPSARTTVSPLVDIGHRLVDQSNVELFTVRSDQRAYWRPTALDQFDGQIWKSDGSYESVNDRLPNG